MLKNVYTTLISKIKQTSLRFMLLHLCFWMLFLFLPILNNFIGDPSVSQHITIKAILSFVIFYFNYFVLVPKLIIKKKIVQYIISITLLMVVFGFIFSVYLTPAHLPKGMIAGRMPRFVNPERAISFIRLFPNALIIILHISFSTMFKLYVEWNNSFKKQKEAETEKKVSELNFLKAQLNPHFFFNSLNTIFSLAIKKSDKTPVALLNLSDLMRYMLYETNKEVVTLNDELLYIENYIELQKLRLTDNNKIVYEKIGNPKGVIIPPLLFISFIENAFKHGTNTAKSSEIRIKFKIDTNEIHFFIVNDINPNRKIEEASGLGEENTIKRLHLYFPEKHTLKMYVENNKFFVDLKLKLNDN